MCKTLIQTHAALWNFFQTIGGGISSIRRPWVCVSVIVFRVFNSNAVCQFMSQLMMSEKSPSRYKDIQRPLEGLVLFKQNKWKPVASLADKEEGKFLWTKRKDVVNDFSFSSEWSSTLQTRPDFRLEMLSQSKSWFVRSMQKKEEFRGTLFFVGFGGFRGLPH